MKNISNQNHQDIDRQKLKFACVVSQRRNRGQEANHRHKRPYRLARESQAPAQDLFTARTGRKRDLLDVRTCWLAPYRNGCGNNWLDFFLYCALIVVSFAHISERDGIGKRAMAAIKANGINLEVVEYGSKSDPAILLIAGWSVQLTFWPQAFIDNLVTAGYRVIVFDNRDVGLSTKIKHFPATSPLAPHILAARILRRKKLAAYTLEDMAADSVGVLDALNIKQAHILGLSMGGMIAQIVAAKYPGRVKSATILMSTTNRFGLPTPPLRLAFDVFVARRGSNQKARVQRSANIWRKIRTQDGGYDDALFADRVQSTIDRAYYPAGRRRQLEAISATGDVRRFTRAITAPTLIIHGSADKLARPHGGLDIAASIPGSRFELIDGMGHDLPPNRIDEVTALIVRHLDAGRKSPPRSRAA